MEAVRAKCQDLKRAPKRSADSEWERGISTGATLILDVLDAYEKARKLRVGPYYCPNCSCVDCRIARGEESE